MESEYFFNKHFLLYFFFIFCIADCLFLVFTFKEVIKIRIPPPAPFNCILLMDNYFGNSCTSIKKKNMLYVFRLCEDQKKRNSKCFYWTHTTFPKS